MKKKEYKKKIEEGEKELAKIEKEIAQSEDLQAQQTLRNEYLQIKSKIEVENAQIGRQMTLIEQKHKYL